MATLSQAIHNHAAVDTHARCCTIETVFLLATESSILGDFSGRMVEFQTRGYPWQCPYAGDSLGAYWVLVSILQGNGTALVLFWDFY